MERKLQHFSHEHPLTLKAESNLMGPRGAFWLYQRRDAFLLNPQVDLVRCKGCSIPITGPFYSCDHCEYHLHKVCAELPNEMNHPMHPQHPLTLLSGFPEGSSRCTMCGGMAQTGREFVYRCSICKFDVDMACASATHPIKDKCHQHPLIPLMRPISFYCDICHNRNTESLSYKCNVCPFWVHQNCTLIPDTVQHSDHIHPLSLLPSLPREHLGVNLFCDICYTTLLSFRCIYGCVRCSFFAHVGCATAKTTESLSMPRNLALLPVQQKSTDLISWFAENYSDRDAVTNLLLGFDERHIDQDTKIRKEIKFFDHEHPLFLVDGQVREEICDACVLPISTPSYGCIDCDYFIHKCCSELPKQIIHPFHSQHLISLWSNNEIFKCDCCSQWSNGFVYKCFECEIYIDIKCASLLRHVKHENHKHPLVPTYKSKLTNLACNACWKTFRDISFSYAMKCTMCVFCLCFPCAMLPSIVKHRYDEHPFKLTYSPPENHYHEYICDLCEQDLNPKQWFYHCGQCDQYTHIHCMRQRGADSNIKYGKCYKFDVHEHKLALVSCTNSGSFCEKCGLPMRTGYSVGLECALDGDCDFKIHLLCALGEPSDLPN